MCTHIHIEMSVNKRKSGIYLEKCLSEFRRLIQSSYNFIGSLKVAARNSNHGGDIGIERKEEKNRVDVCVACTRMLMFCNAFYF